MENISEIKNEIDMDKFIFFLPIVRQRIEDEGLFDEKRKKIIGEEKIKNEDYEEKSFFSETFYDTLLEDDTDIIETDANKISFYTNDDEKLMVNFCIELLYNPDSNPSIIRWLNKTELVFKIENPSRMAKLWGERKGNDKMNYDKMSRAIRYGRTTGNFLIPNKKLYKTQYVHQFGEKAINKSEWLQYLRKTN